MRNPTIEADALAWHANALEDAKFLLPIEFDQNEPQCGYFEGRMCRGGIMMPAQIWIEQEKDEVTGELVGDEVFWCEHGGVLRDPYEHWIWLARNPITKERFEFLMADWEWARTWAPNEPRANPFKKVNWLETPIPTF